MALINTAKREVHCKIVYYGPGLAGKTTNLQQVYWNIRKDQRSDLLSIATETERTLFFDFQHPTYHTFSNFTVRFHLYTVPGCGLYERTKRAVLKGADGIVFVADSQQQRMAMNITSLKEIVLELHEQQRTILQLPIVLQYNKRDVPSILPVEQLDYYLNRMRWPQFEASAVDGVGVMETLDAICMQVLQYLQDQKEGSQRIPRADETAIVQGILETPIEDAILDPRKPWIEQVRNFFRWGST